jgi:hypothetical protein
MDVYEQIDRQVQKEIEYYEQAYANGEISQQELNENIRRVEREARAELREHENSQRHPW